MSETERRMSLRFDPQTFRKLEKRRVDEDTSFQEVGERLFGQWLSGEAPPPPGPFGELTKDEERILRAALDYLRHGPENELMQTYIRMLPKLWPRKS